MSNNLMKSSGIKPQSSSRLVKPSVGRRSFSKASEGSNSEGLASLKKVDDVGGELAVDQVDELPQLLISGSSGSRINQQRRESDGSMTAAEVAAYQQARRLSEAGIRRLSETSIVLTSNTDTFMVGEKVYVNGVKPGHIQYIGETKFAPGEWAGIVLEDNTGKNDGSVGGVRYFQCQPNRGIFSRLSRLTRQPLDSESLAALMASQTFSEGSAGDETQRSSSPSVRSHKSSSPAPQGGSTVSVQAIGDLRIGDRVVVTSSQGSKAGTLRYLGTTDFAGGQWAGVELDESIGKNDGSVAGKRYFNCPPMHGLFAPVSKVARCAASRKTSTNSTTSSTPKLGRHESVVTTTSTIITSSRLSPSPVTVKTRSPASSDPPRKEIQDLLTEKDRHIQQLLKEREMDRAEVIRAAAQANAAEKKLAQAQKQLELQQAATETLRSNFLTQIDDLQFRVEEQSIQHAELKNKCANLLSSNRDLEKQLSDEKRRTEQLENEAQGGFEAEEVALKYKEEVEALRNELNVVNSLKKKLQDALDSKDQEITKLKSGSLRNADVDNSANKIKSAHAQCALLIQQVEDLTLKCSRMEETLSYEKRKQEDLNRQLEQRNLEFVERVGELQRKFENSENRYAQVAREKAELEAKLQEHHQSKNLENSRLAELSQQLRTALDDLNRERKKNKELCSSEAEYEGELQILRKKTFESDEQIKNLEADLMYLEEENETLRKKVAQLEAANELLRNNQQTSEDRFQKYTEDYSRWEKEREQYKTTLKDREIRLTALTDEVERLRITFDAHRTELHEKLAETRKETEAVKELQIALEKARIRVEQLEQILDETEDERNKALDEKHELEVLLLQERDSNKSSRIGKTQLLETTQNEINQLRLECEKLHNNAQKDDFEVVELRQNLTNRESEIKKLQVHVKSLEKKSEELHQFRAAWSALEKEKRHLEEKVVELQVLVARYQSSKPMTKAELRVEELKEENETFKREIDFLNSVIVDMQRKVDDLELQLELNQPNQLGHILSDLSLNGTKSSVVTPRLFCDICDGFDLHDTEDCPKQAMDYSNGDM